QPVDEIILHRAEPSAESVEAVPGTCHGKPSWLPSVVPGCSYMSKMRATGIKSIPGCGPGPGTSRACGLPSPHGGRTDGIPTANLPITVHPPTFPVHASGHMWMVPGQGVGVPARDNLKQAVGATHENG